MMKFWKLHTVGNSDSDCDPACSHCFFLSVNPADAPGYYKVIKKPMDFSTVKRKLEVTVLNFEFKTTLNKLDETLISSANT